VRSACKCGCLSGLAKLGGLNPAFIGLGRRGRRSGRKRRFGRRSESGSGRKKRRQNGSSVNP